MPPQRENRTVGQGEAEFQKVDVTERDWRMTGRRHLVEEEWYEYRNNLNLSYIVCSSVSDSAMCHRINTRTFPPHTPPPCASLEHPSPS